jgi:uncharacterized protein YcbK (DUF882 family)
MQHILLNYMRSQRLGLVLAIVMSALWGVGTAHASGRKKPAASAHTRARARTHTVAKKKAKLKLVCKGKGKKRTCKRQHPRVVITSRHVADSELRQAPLWRPSGHVHVYAVAFGKDLEVDIYNPDGSYNQAALAALDEIWACHKTREVRAVDPRLYEVLSMLNDTYGGRVELNSGFRYQRNEGSRHFHASAMDVRISGVSWKDVASYTETLDPGGMGIGRYPYMGFVHIDFRAPGERSVRWTDTSRGIDRSDPGKQPSRAWRRGPNT